MREDRDKRYWYAYGRHQGELHSTYLTADSRLSRFTEADFLKKVRGMPGRSGTDDPLVVRGLPGRAVRIEKHGKKVVLSADDLAQLVSSSGSASRRCDVMDTTIIERGATIADLDAYPTDDGNRYELIDGEIHVSTTPHRVHQRIVRRLGAALTSWDMRDSMGEACPALGVIFDDENAAIPDLAWVSAERAPEVWRIDDGKMHAAPDLAVEVLSEGSANEKRDRQDKLRMYARFGVLEYWIIDRFEQQVDVYRREGEQLRLAVQLGVTDDLTSPLLPGFVCSLRWLLGDTE
jgi:Uma2 family endonuclease